MDDVSWKDASFMLFKLAALRAFAPTRSQEVLEGMLRMFS